MPDATQVATIAVNISIEARNRPESEPAASERHFIIKVAGKALGLSRAAAGPVHGTGLSEFIATGTCALTGSAAPTAQHRQFTPEILQDHFG